MCYKTTERNLKYEHTVNLVILEENIICERVCMMGNFSALFVCDTVCFHLNKMLQMFQTASL